MKFDEIILNKMEQDILKCLKIHRANIWELHGYFHFPGMELILVSLQTLLKNELIYQEDIQESDKYTISLNGEKYLMYITHKKHTQFWKRIGAIIATLGSLVVIAEFALPALANLPL